MTGTGDLSRDGLQTGRKRVASLVEAVSTYFWKGVTLSWIEFTGQAAVLVLRDARGGGWDD